MIIGLVGYHPPLPEYILHDIFLIPIGNIRILHFLRHIYSVGWRLLHIFGQVISLRPVQILLLLSAVHAASVTAVLDAVGVVLAQAKRVRLPHIALLSLLPIL